MMRKISVIIPVYNVARYLCEGLDSLFSQKNVSLEVIAVNDMSFDGSRDILEKYMMNHPEMTILDTGVNSGQAYARNRGLDVATGEFVYFFDADDYLNSTTSLYEAVSAIEKTWADGVCFDADIVYENGLYGDNTIEEDIEEGLYKGPEYFSRFMSSPKYSVSVWRQLWRRDFIERRKLSFVKEASPHEDLLFTTEAFLSANNIYRLRKKLYTYRVRAGSSITDKGYKKRLRANLCCYVEGIRFVQHNNISNELLYRFFTATVQMSYKECVDFINSGGNLEGFFDDCGNDSFFYKLVLMSRFPYLKRWPRYEELIAIRNSNTVIIYGAGKAGMDTVSMLEMFGILDCVFAVTSDEHIKQKKEIVIDSILEMDNYQVILAATENNRFEMEKKLDRLGIKNYFSFA